MKATRYLLLLALASTACLPGSGISPAQTVVANPDPQISGAGATSPLAVRQTPERSAAGTAASPASSGNSKKTLLIVAGVVVVAAIVILLASGGSGGLGY